MFTIIFWEDWLNLSGSIDRGCGELRELKHLKIKMKNTLEKEEGGTRQTQDSKELLGNSVQNFLIIMQPSVL